MPSLGGVGFFEQLEERYPNMAARTIFVTAFADEPPVRAFLEQTGQPYFGKPFLPNELLASVAEIGRARSSR
jgi:DNA-binding response OmpR family regulator